MENYEEYVGKIINEMADKLSLKDYFVAVSYTDDLYSEHDVNGGCQSNQVDRSAHIILDIPYLEEESEASVRRLVVHEMLELRLANMRYHLGVLYCDDVISELAHEVIRPLERLL